jgi:hypothetical protein
MESKQLDGKQSGVLRLFFEIRDGKIYSFIKEWDKLNMWKQLGLMDGDNYV